MLTTIYNYLMDFSTFLYGSVLIVLLLSVGIFFSFKTNFVQIKYLLHSIKLITSSKSSKNNKNSISSLEALSTSLASLIGVGSIAGMSLAISVGGPGAIFWVWIITILGMATNFSEHVLGQVFKKKTSIGLYLGGPAYYLSHGLKNHALAKIFAVLLIITYAISFNAVQANTISSSFFTTFNMPTSYTAIGLIFFTAIIIFGGIKHIAKISSILVPIMGATYLLLAITMIILNITAIPSVLKLIFTSAFGVKQAVAGGISYSFMLVLITGVKRAMFSTEAGIGSSPNIGASAMVDHPVQQGLVGMLGVFTVGFIICTSTAMIILFNSDLQFTGEMQGAVLVQSSIAKYIGSWGVIALFLCILVFGLTSIIGNYSYAENNLNFLSKNKNNVIILRIIVILFVGVGAIADLAYVWNLADLLMAFMILINVYALVRLYPVIVAVTKDYFNQLKKTDHPIFKKSNIGTLLNNDKDNIWE